MPKYAMVLLNNVIGILEQEEIPHWPPDPQGNPVTAIECGEDIVLGMVYNSETEEFEDYVPPAYIPTQLDRIEDKLAQNYEQAQQSAVDSYTEQLINEGVL